jgi:hypothetical protein
LLRSVGSENLQRIDRVAGLDEVNYGYSGRLRDLCVRRPHWSKVSGPKVQFLTWPHGRILFNVTAQISQHNEGSSMPMKRFLGGSAVAIALCLVSTSAYAGSSAALLKRLHDKGILSDEDYSELLKEDTEQAQSAVTAPPPAPVQPPRRAAAVSSRRLTADRF